DVLRSPILCGSVPATAAVATATTAATAAVATATATGPRPLFARAGLIDGEGPALELLAVHAGDGLVGPGVHLHERKAPAPAGVAVADDLRAENGPELGERLHEVIAGGVERNVPDVQLLRHFPYSGPSGPAHRNDARSHRAKNRNGRVPAGAGHS